MPSIDADTSVEAAEDGPLLGLRESTTSIYNQIETLFAQNLTNMQTLGNDGWIGPEYDSALADITNLTGLVTDATTNSRDVLTSDITNQLQALGFSG